MGRYGAALPGWAWAGMLFHHWQGHVLRHTLHGGRPRPRTVHRSHNEVVGDNLRGPYFVAYNFIVGAVDGARSRAASMEGVAEDMPLPVMEQHPCSGPSGQCRSIPSLGHLNTPLLRRRLRRQLKKDPVIHLDPADLPAVDGGPNLNVISHNSVTTIVR